MNEQQRAALAALRLSWVQAPDDVWRRSPYHVDGLHESALRDVRDGIAEAAASPDASPIGLVLEGRQGSGKTHLLGLVREQVQQQGGYFFLVGLLGNGDFWDGLLVFLLDGLARETSDGETQLRLLLRRLASRIGAPRADRRAVIGETDLTEAALSSFVSGLGAYNERVARQCRSTLRALALRASADEGHQDIAESYFAGAGEAVPGERQSWKISARARETPELVREISSLLALTGPSVIAFDQIDTAVAQAAVQADLAKMSVGEANVRQAALVADLAHGVSDLRDLTQRTLLVIATLSATWDLVVENAPASLDPRFRRRFALQGIRDVRIAREIIARRFAPRFAATGFTPDYATWPILEDAFQEALNYTPRSLIMAVDRHIRACLIRGEARQLTRLADVPSEKELAGAPPVPLPQVADEEMARIEARFEELKRDANVTLPLEGDTEDSTFPGLLAAGLQAWIAERGDGGRRFGIDPPPSSKPDLHARLRRDLDERSEEEREHSPDQSRTEDQVHWAFRAISDTHHGVAALHRIRRARTAAGLTAEVTKRKLFLLRNGDWSQSAKTQEVVEQLKRDGGVTLPVDESDLRILDALDKLRTENPASLQAWLLRYRPTEQIRIFKEALADADTWTGEEVRRPDTPPTERGESFTIGTGVADGVPVSLSLEALRKHAAIFAASGSGKTVLLRRLIEECALRGVSVIVLDPNNDLARLGDPWPEPPTGWGPGDAERAARYLAGTEVVTWTPRRESGRPLSFQPLPDFASVRDDPDELGAAVEAAVTALAPRANLIGRTERVNLRLAVLRKAVEHFARRGGSDVRGLIGLLSDLPDGVSELADAQKIAAGLGQTLTASMDNDPLFGGAGAAADPGTLLTPSAGKRARISVISLIGLPGDEARQSFVNQLQMGLFAWIKRHPATDRPLLGLLVMDEAQTLAPSGAMTACTQSTLALASQARKYGLGLIFATQSPKGLHNRIPGNAATHVFGRITAPVQIEAAREMAKVKGGDVPDIGNLTAGDFYIALEGEAPCRARTPMCLSHHPSSPLTDEEVMARARA
ncbi:ATP-binding protein [Actinoplanes subtropicus]|uniref:ATP-binding protein n=1 Tax=Actinoplanes subtropicus TaxID=543632 RepID=UPI0004C36879|nr:ATP-binding protein [Actinoplanes subtropicus]